MAWTSLTRSFGSSRKGESPSLAPWKDASKAIVVKPESASLFAYIWANCSFIPPSGVHDHQTEGFVRLVGWL